MQAASIYSPKRSFKDKALVATWYLLYYALVWAPLFGISWLLQRFVDDPVLKTIFDVLYYAGYPVYGVFWAVVALIGFPIMGIMWLITHTMPYCLYALAFAPAVILIIWFKNRYVTPKDSPEETRRKNVEAGKKHKPFNPFDSDTKL